MGNDIVHFRPVLGRERGPSRRRSASGVPVEALYDYMCAVAEHVQARASIASTLGSSITPARVAFVCWDPQPLSGRPNCLPMDSPLESHWTALVSHPLFSRHYIGGVLGQVPARLVS
jgi:hypothetical protein